MRERVREFIPSENYRKDDVHGYAGNILRLLTSCVLASEADIIERRRRVSEGQTLRFSRDRIR